MVNKSHSIGLIVLAAGASVRYGDFPKQLLKFKGKTLIRNAVEQALASRAELICVVLGANYAVIKKEIEDLPVETVFNKNWADGLSSSIKFGLNHLLTIKPDISAVVLQLCDQPLINAEIINRLIQAFCDTPKEIIASEYGETYGVPAIFGKNLFSEILNLNSQAGAKKIIAGNIENTGFIKAPQAAFDVDTPQDYEKLLHSESVSEGK